mgnify:CR=1 FL=1
MIDIFEELKRMLSHQFGLDAEIIEEESLLDEDLSLTDLDLEDFIAKVEEKYEIEIPQDKLPQFKKVSDIVTYLYENAQIA